jgi:hypothetical protein
MRIERPQRPTHLPAYAEACLQALVESGLSHAISLGGAFGLLHYYDYRPTHDVDAWWTDLATSDVRQRVVAGVRAVLEREGETRVRAWGDVVSVELLTDGRAVFSFQVAQRSALLEPLDRADWIDVPLDSLADLLASKMTALVERGAPRDFRDVYSACQAGLTTPVECWAVWAKRQQLAGSDADFDRARLAIETHLARISQYRRLEQIADPQQQAEASEVRRWFEEELLNAAV